MPKLKILFICLFIVLHYSTCSHATRLQEILDHGELRHLGVPYANFVTGLGDGFSVELIKGFCNELGVKYVFVNSSWNTVISDLIGKTFLVQNGNVKKLGNVPVRGDLIANGLTILPWREKLLSFSDPVFPTQVMIVSSIESRLKTIKNGHDISQDIKSSVSQLNGIRLLGKYNTCLDIKLYDVKGVDVHFVDFPGNLNDLIPAVIAGKADATLLDMPDILIGLSKWPGKIKVIGPVSDEQAMAVAFTKDACKLRERFNAYLKRIKADGTYYDLVMKYYPLIMQFKPDFFINVRAK